MAVSIAYRAIQNGYDARFTTAAQLIEERSAAARDGRLSEGQLPYVQPHVLVIDEVGYLTYSADAANVLFQVVDHRYPETNTLVRSSRIDKLYVHDDGIGPFARIEFGTPELTVPRDGKDQKILTTLKSPWRGGLYGEAAPGTVWFGPWALIVPLYHKIRIPLDKILEKVVQFDEEYRKLAESSERLPLQLEWDIYLATQGEVKSEIRTASDLSPEQRWRILERPMPRFVWRATAYDGESRFIDLLYDATDIDQGDFLIDQVIYDMHARTE